MITFDVSYTIQSQRIADLFTSAIEGSCAHWLGRLKYHDGRDYGKADAYTEGLKIDVQYDDPDGQEGEYALNKTISLDDIAKGYKILAESYPSHFADIEITEDDADTANALLQCIVLGEVVFE